jgi:hypothetical protein
MKMSGISEMLTVDAAPPALQTDRADLTSEVIASNIQANI